MQGRRNAFGWAEDQGAVPVEVEEARSDVQAVEVDHDGVSCSDRVGSEARRDASVLEQERCGLRRRVLRVEKQGVTKENARHLRRSVPELRSLGGSVESLPPRASGVRASCLKPRTCGTDPVEGGRPA